MKKVMLVKTNGPGFQLNHQQGGQEKPMWTNKKELKHNGIYVKLHNMPTASGHVISMIDLFSSFNEKQMPMEILMTKEVPWMSVRTNLDARNVDKEYLILMKQNEDVKQFYE